MMNWTRINKIKDMALEDSEFQNVMKKNGQFINGNDQIGWNANLVYIAIYGGYLMGIGAYDLVRDM